MALYMKTNTHFCILVFIGNAIDKIEVPLKSDKNKWHFT